MKRPLRRALAIGGALLVIAAIGIGALEIYASTPQGQASLSASTDSPAAAQPLASRVYDMPPEQTRQVAAAVIPRLPNWKLVTSEAPSEDGSVQAEVKKAFGLLTDKVIVRVVADGKNARVTVASASRIEDGVMGANAGNIRALQAAMDERLPPAS